MMNCTLKKAKQPIVGYGRQKGYSSITAMMVHLQLWLMRVVHFLLVVRSDVDLVTRRRNVKMECQLLWCLLLPLKKRSFMW
jgi:hypothetical protein